jgi:predicted phosphoribosyltransferase
MLRAIAHPSALGRFSSAEGIPAFADRRAAGAALAERLARLRGKDLLILGIPRGGVPVAAAVAAQLEAELDVLVARKLCAPISEELAIGAVTADGGRFLNQELIRELGAGDAYIERVTKQQMMEAKSREVRFRGDLPAPRIAGRVVVLVDDGLATGATMIAAARAVKALKPAQLIVAVPVASWAAIRTLKKEADEVECLVMPDPFWAVGAYYEDFSQTQDAEVERLLRESREVRTPSLVAGSAT